MCNLYTQENECYQENEEKNDASSQNKKDKQQEIIWEGP